VRLERRLGMTTRNLSIDTTIEIAAPPSKILEALTTEAGYRAWLTETATYDDTHAAFPFERADGTRLVRFRIDHKDAHGIAMTCVAEQANPDWFGTELAFSIEGNRVRVVHSGYRTRNETYEQSIAGWTYFLGSLKSYVETGRGTPNKAQVR
jgi:uncharacterized protein YndB with AHSA1/START domain